MTNQVSWFDGVFSSQDLGLESFESDTPLVIEQGPSRGGPEDYFNPVNIVIENGVYYVTIYACCVGNQSTLAQSLSIWLASLKNTDHIKLSVSSLLTNIPFGNLVTVMGALANTKAYIEILLDQIVMDGLAYFYLLADKVTQMEAGALFIPSYVAQRREDMSIPQKAVHDFYNWIIEDAVTTGRLTEEEAERLNAGSHVILPPERLQ